ncbi:MAG: hypothetical protein JRN67_04760 [Nitrososphaerota archaeon]|nr:hypothetical protein [Nitrososphaerota archaeon]
MTTAPVRTPPPQRTFWGLTAGELVASFLGVAFGDITWAVWRQVWVVPNYQIEVIAYVILTLLGSILFAWGILYQVIDKIPRLKSSNPFSKRFGIALSSFAFVLAVLDVIWNLSHGSGIL